MSEIPAVDYQIIATLTGQPVEALLASPQIRPMCALLTADNLTGLYNRRYLQLRLALELESAQDSELSLLVLDLNQFKHVNDHFGHAAGDQVLMETARAIDRHLPDTGVAARFGGDEFLIVLPGCSGPEAARWANALLTDLRSVELRLDDGERITGCSGSIGIATWPQDGATADELFKRADQAMYRAKRSRRDICQAAPGVAAEPTAPAADGRRPSAPAEDLPTGSITLFFSQLERSAQAALTAEGLVRHDTLAASMVEQHGGVVYQRRLLEGTLEGAFARPQDALAAACALQRLLRKSPWAAAGMGAGIALLTGSTELVNGAYVGDGVSRCQQLQLLAHPGQVLLCQATAERLRGDLPAGTVLEDLGSHRLRDLFTAERVSQVLFTDHPVSFPPLKSLNTLPNNLPVQTTRFIGREVAIGQVREQLVSGRLVTLTGAGGCGKSRLALQVAAELAVQFADGVWWVQLAALPDLTLVVQAVASALGMAGQPGTPLRKTLEAQLKDRHLLLVLDNCEYLAATCAHLADRLLPNCPGVRILATSRRPLGAAAESLLLVPSLSLPDTDHPSPEELLRSDAVRLFLDRAGAHQQDISLRSAAGAAAAQICRRLDGIPLAIQLAAAQLQVQTPAAILAQLTDRLRLLGAASEEESPRQRTLRAAVDWTHALLQGPERELWQRLTVFAGSFTAVAAEAVVSGVGIPAGEILNILSNLIDRSLLRTDPSRQSQFLMLNTIRHFGLDKLRTSEEEPYWRRRHAEWCLALVEAAAPHLQGSRTAVLPDADFWLKRLDQEYANLQAALQWCAQADEEELGLRMAAALAPYWRWRSYFAEGRDWALAFLERPFPPTALWARAVLATTDLLRLAGETRRVGLLLTEALPVLRSAGDQKAVAAALQLMGRLDSFQGALAPAAERLHEALSLLRNLGGGPPLIRALADAWAVALRMGHAPRTTLLFEECLSLARNHGDRRLLAEVLHEIGQQARALGQGSLTQPLLTEALAVSRELGDRPGIARALFNLGALAQVERDWPRSVQFLTESLAIRRALGYRLAIADCHSLLGRSAFALQEHETAALHHREALALRQQMADKSGIVDSLGDVAHQAMAWGEAEHAARLMGAATALLEEIGQPPVMGSYASFQERSETAARSALGDLGFRIAFDEGRAMLPGTATKYALALLAPERVRKHYVTTGSSAALPPPRAASPAVRQAWAEAAAAKAEDPT